jgi:hypothetical protein
MPKTYIVEMRKTIEYHALNIQADSVADAIKQAKNLAGYLVESETKLEAVHVGIIGGENA